MTATYKKAMQSSFVIVSYAGLDRRISELLWKIKRNGLALTAHAHVFTWYGLGYQNEIWQNHLIFRKSSETNGGSVKLCGRKIVAYTSPGYILLKCLRTLYSNVLVFQNLNFKNHNLRLIYFRRGKTWWILSVLNENTLKTEVLKPIDPLGEIQFYMLSSSVLMIGLMIKTDYGYHNLSS